MSRVLKTPMDVTNYFYKHMAKDDVLAQLESGELEPKQPVLKWLRNNSSWENTIVHSGQLECCLKGRGFGFQSFIPSVTNGKETIVIYNITRSYINFIKVEAGSGYLQKYARRADSKFVTSTLSVLIEAGPNLPVEVQLMITEFTENSNVLLFDPKSEARILMSEKIRKLESEFDSKLSREARSASFGIVNKASQYFSAPIETVVSDIENIIRTTAKNGKLGREVEAAFNKLSEFSVIADEALLWATSPEVKIASIFKKRVVKAANEVKTIKKVNKAKNTAKSTVNKNKTVIKNFTKK